MAGNFIDNGALQIASDMYNKSTPYIMMYASYTFGRTWESCHIYNYKNNEQGHAYASPSDDIYKFSDYQLIYEIDSWQPGKSHEGHFRLNDAYKDGHPPEHGDAWQNFKTLLDEGHCNFHLI